jgi:hypothetical protein
MPPRSPPKPLQEDTTEQQTVPVTGPHLVEWSHLPLVSGLQCIGALQRAGFVVQARTSRVVDLSQGGEVIRVPLAEKLDWEVLVVILYRAGIGPAAFAALLEE